MTPEEVLEIKEYLQQRGIKCRVCGDVPVVFWFLPNGDPVGCCVAHPLESENRKV